MDSIENARNIRILFPRQSSAEKELLKTFFDFIGCNVIESMTSDDNMEIIVDNKTSVFFELDLSKKYFRIDKTVIQDKNICLVDFEIQALSIMIGRIWEDQNKTSIEKISSLFFKLKLFPYIQMQQTFKVVNMGEVHSLGIDHYYIPDHEYIEKMATAFIEFKNQSRDIPKSVYSIYAATNCDIRIREIKKVLAIDSKIRKDLHKSTMSVDFLFDKLNEIYQIDSSYSNEYFLAARLCLSDRLYWLDAYEYYQELKNRSSIESKEIYSWRIYQLGRYAQNYLNEKNFAEKYYSMAKDQWDKCYPAIFQCGCHHAEHKEFDVAISDFESVVNIVSRDFQLKGDLSSDEIKLSEDWSYLTLREIKYLYKACIWMMKIALNQKGEAAICDYAQKALLCVVAYKKALILKNSCDSDDYNELLQYHETDITVRALLIVLRTMIGDSSVNESLQKKVNELISKL